MAPPVPTKLNPTAPVEVKPVVPIQVVTPVTTPAPVLGLQTPVDVATLLNATKLSVFKPISSIVYKPIQIVIPPGGFKFNTITYQVLLGAHTLTAQGQNFAVSINFDISGPATTIDFTYTGLPAHVTPATFSVAFAGNATRRIFLNFSVPRNAVIQAPTPFVIHYSGFNGSQKGDIPISLQIWSGFPMQHQLYNEWCWAAVTSSVDHFYNPESTLTQCLVVNQQRGRSDCCSNGGSSDCNQPGYTDQALQAAGRLSQSVGSAASYATVVQQTSAWTPIAMRIGWAGGGGHAIVASGYESNSMVVIDDPWYGPSVVAYNTLVNAYQGSGTWTNSFYTKA